MPKTLRLLTWIVLGSLLFSSQIQSSAAQTGDNFSIFLHTPAYEITQDENGYYRVEIAGFEPSGRPGEPELPAKAYAIGVPPDAALDSVTFQVMQAKMVELPGVYEIAPVTPAATVVGGEEIIDWGENAASIVSGKDMRVYRQDTFFPHTITTPGSTAQMRKWRWANLVFTPVQYNPVTKKLRVATEVELRVEFERQPSPQSLLNDTAMDGRAAQILYNYAQARPWYQASSMITLNRRMQNSLASADAPSAAGYVIITTNAIKTASSKLNSFVAHKQGQGYSVEVVTETQFDLLTGDPPNGRPEQIRQWLKNNYIAKNILYVLLIGNPDPYNPDVDGDLEGDLPMKLVWPRVGAADGWEFSGTDYYYADLTGDWDLDNDSRYGEYEGDRGAGGVDFTNEVYVGRIPVYSEVEGWAAHLDSILQKTMDFENASDRSWRKTALLPMPFSEDDTDGAYLAEQMKSDYLDGAGYTTYTQYQYTGEGCTSIFASNENLVGGSVVDHWSSNSYGIVAWFAHGNPHNALVGYGNSGEPCREDGTLLYRDDVSRLNNSRPAIVFQGSCFNAWPEYTDSLSYMVLLQGGVIDVSATSLSFYENGNFVPNQSKADTSTVGYYFVKRIVAGDTAGVALYDEKSAMGALTPGWGDETWINLMTFNLLGDASLRLGVQPPPTAPGSLSATAVSHTQVDLSWTDNSSDESGFSIQRSLDGSSWTALATVGANVQSYADTGLSDNTKYHYRVRAYNLNGNSAYSNTASATTPAYPPAAPGSLAATPVSQTQIDLSWVDNSGNEDGYRIQRSPDGSSGWTQIGTTGPNETSYSDQALSCKTDYYYRVQAYNSGGDSGYSPVAHARTHLCIPAAPGDLNASAVSQTRIDLNWTDNSGNEDGFKIERSPDGSSGWTLIHTTAAGVTTYQNLGLNSDTTYYYRVRATNGDGDSSPSNTAAATTPPFPPAPPHTLTATATAHNRSNLSWTDSSNNESGFKIERSPDGSSWTERATVGANVQSYTDTGLVDNTLYYYRVFAYNAGGSSGYSNTASAKTPLEPPANLSATAVSQTQIDLSWTDHTHNESGFKIERSPDGSGGWVETGTAGAGETSYTDADRACGTIYYYRVRAYSGDEHSVYSSIDSATTVVCIPAAPQNLTATVISQTQVDLSWLDESNNETGFKILRSPTGDEGSWEQVGQTGAGATSFSNTGLTGDTTYYYRICAYNAGGDSEFSNVTSATTPPYTATTPEDLTAVPVSPTQINLAWADKSDNEDGFEIERSPDGASGWTKIGTVTAGVTGFQDTGLTDNTDYFYRVRAHNAGGYSEYSETASARTLMAPPAAPSNLGAVAISQSQINLTWVDNSSNEDGFKIERSPDGSSGWSQVATAGENATTYQFKNLGSETTHFYRVRAYRGSVHSSYSNTSGATTLPELPDPPVKPSNLYAVPISDNEIELFWFDNSGNEIGFRIERSASETGSDWVQIAAVGPDVTTIVDSGLDCYKMYFYRVQAYNLGGSSYSVITAAQCTCSLAPDSNRIYLPLLNR